jgi:hypothetical protein
MIRFETCRVRRPSRRGVSGIRGDRSRRLGARVVYWPLGASVYRVLTLLGLRRTGRDRPPQRTSEPSDRYAGLAVPGSSAANVLNAIMAADKTFNVHYFIEPRRQETPRGGRPARL